MTTHAFDNSIGGVVDIYPVRLSVKYLRIAKHRKRRKLGNILVRLSQRFAIMIAVLLGILQQEKQKFQTVTYFSAIVSILYLVSSVTVGIVFHKIS